MPKQCLLFFYMSGLEGSLDRYRVDVKLLTLTVLPENKLLKPASLQDFKTTGTTVPIRLAEPAKTPQK